MRKQSLDPRDGIERGVNGLDLNPSLYASCMSTPHSVPSSLIVGYEIEDLCLNDHLLLFSLLFCQYKIVASSLSYTHSLTPVSLTSALFFHLRQSPSIDSLSLKIIMVYFTEKELVLSRDRERKR